MASPNFADVVFGHNAVEILGDLKWNSESAPFTDVSTLHLIYF